mmetsp:Transcript_32940/g.65622  ORF Transcript_32940/g.65622 Transcript_32940/m.65622 type:complete len:356 (-) Transcript_32940:221-1288(-)
MAIPNMNQVMTCAVFALSVGVAISAAQSDDGKADKHGDDHSFEGEYVFEWHNIFWLCHFASLLEAVAFLQPTMIRLRMFETAGSGLIAVYSIIHTHNLIDCHFMWGTLHFLINGQKVFVYLQKKYAGRKLRDEELALIAPGGVFDIFDHVEYDALQRHAIWFTLAKGEELMSVNNPVERLMLLTSGSVEVVAASGDVIVATIDVPATSGVCGSQFFGEMCFFTDNPASATVRVVSGQARVLCFNMTEVRRLCRNHGHTLEATVFRQLPSLFATQLAARTKAMLSSDDGKKTAPTSFGSMFGSSFDNPEGGAPPILNRWAFKQLSTRPAKVSPRVPDESSRVMAIESGGEAKEIYP